MEFNLNENKEVVVLLGAGSMGTAIVKRISTNRIIGITIFINCLPWNLVIPMF